MFCLQVGWLNMDFVTDFSRKKSWNQSLQFICLPGTQMTLVLVGKDLVFGGWPSKIEVSLGFQVGKTLWYWWSAFWSQRSLQKKKTKKYCFLLNDGARELQNPQNHQGRRCFSSHTKEISQEPLLKWTKLFKIIRETNMTSSWHCVEVQWRTHAFWCFKFLL